MNIKKLLHLHGIHVKWNMFLVNRIYAGDSKPRHFKKKRQLLLALGFEIGENTKIVGPVELHGKVSIGKNCWIGKNFRVNGIGSVIIGDNCDIAPEVTFQTGGHLIGTPERRAGEEQIFHQTVGSGTWIGGRSTILGNTSIGASCVIAGCACVTKDVPEGSLVGGVPARLIRKLDDDTE